MARTQRYTGLAHNSLQAIRGNWGVLIAIIILSAILLWLAPAEQTLGQGIKVVYLHVALIWTGMTGMVLAGLLGLAVLISGRFGLEKWTHTLGWVAFAFFLGGIGMSL